MFFIGGGLENTPTHGGHLAFDKLKLTSETAVESKSPASRSESGATV